MSPPVGVVWSNTRSRPGENGFRWTIIIMITVEVTRIVEVTSMRTTRSFVHGRRHQATGRRTMRRPDRVYHGTRGRSSAGSSMAGSVRRRRRIVRHVGRRHAVDHAVAAPGTSGPAPYSRSNQSIASSGPWPPGRVGRLHVIAHRLSVIVSVQPFVHRRHHGLTRVRTNRSPVQITRPRSPGQDQTRSG